MTINVIKYQHEILLPYYINIMEHPVTHQFSSLYPYMVAQGWIAYFSVQTLWYYLWCYHTAVCTSPLPSRVQVSGMLAHSPNSERSTFKM